MSVMWATLKDLREIHGQNFSAIMRMAEALQTQENSGAKDRRRLAFRLFSDAVRLGVVIQ